METYSMVNNPFLPPGAENAVEETQIIPTNTVDTPTPLEEDEINPFVNNFDSAKDNPFLLPLGERPDPNGANVPLRAKVLEQVDKEPARELEVKNFSKDNQLPYSFVDRNLDMLKKERKKEEFKQVETANPFLASWLSQSEGRVATTKDDLININKTSLTAQRFKFSPEKSWTDEMSDMTTDVGRGLKTNYIQIAKGAYISRLSLGQGTPEERRGWATEIANRNKLLTERSQNDPAYYKRYREQAGKKYNNLQKKYVEVINQFEKDWDDDVLKNLSELGSKSGGAVEAFFDSTSLMANSKKALMYTASQSLLNSLAPMVLGVGGGVVGAKVGAAAGAPIGAAIGTFAGGPAFGAGAAAQSGAYAAGIGFSAGFLMTATFAGLALEYPAEFEHYLSNDKKVDMSDPDQILAAFDNPEIAEEAHSRGLKKGVTTASVEAVFTLLGGKIFGAAKPGLLNKAKALGVAHGVDAVGETAGEFGGQVASRGLKEAEVGSAIEEGVVSIITGGGLQGLTYVASKTKSVNEVRKQFAPKVTEAIMQVKEANEKSREAKAFKQGLDDLTEVVQDTKLNTDDKAELADLIQGSSEKSAVFFQADEWVDHWEKLGENPSEKADELLPGGNKDLRTALEEGSPLSVPLGDYITKFSEEESFTRLSELVRKDPEALNFAQANSISANIPGLLKELSAEAKRELQVRATHEDAIQAVKNDVESQAINAGASRQEAKEAGVLYAANMNSLATILGIDAVDMFKKRRLEIQKGREDITLGPDQFAQKSKEGFNLKPKETISPALESVQTVRRRSLSDFKNAVRSIHRKLDTKSKISSVLGSEAFKNTHTGRDLLISEKSLNNVVDQIYQTRSESVNKRKQKKSDVVFSEGLTAVKNLPTLVEDAILVATQGDTDIFFAAGTSSKNNIAVKIEVKGNEIVGIQTVALGAKDTVSSTEGAAEAAVQPQLTDEISLSDFLEIVNTGRQVAPKLFQKKGKTPRAFIDLSDPMKMVINILKKANKSSLLHEMGHAFLENMKIVKTELDSLAEHNTIQRQFMTDIETILEEFGVASLDDIGEVHHEKFARLIEAYLQEGKAPSKRLKSVFKKFTTWLTEIYKNIAGIERDAGFKLPLTDNMKEVFNRLVATQEEINEESVNAGYDTETLISYFEKLGIKNTEDNPDLDKLLNAHDEAQAEAELILYRKQLKQLKAKETKAYNKRAKELKAKFTEAAEASPLYIAIDAIKNHTIGDLPVLGYETLKFNTEKLKNYFISEEFKSFPRSLYSATGIDPEIVADLLGFESAASLIEGIDTNPSKKEFIRQATELALDKEFPNFMSPEQQGELKVAAIDAVNNDDRATALKLEFEIMLKQGSATVKNLIKRFNRRLPGSKELKAEVKKRIADTPLKQLKGTDFKRIENKARRESGELLVKGDIEAAVKTKVQEIYNHELAKEAARAKETIDKRLEKVNRRYKKPDKKLVKVGMLDMLKAGQSIMARYGLLTEVQTKKLDVYLAQLSAYDSRTYEKVKGLTDSLIQIDDKPFSQLTTDEMTEILDVLDALYDLGVDEKFVTVDGKKIDKEEAINSMVDELKTMDKKAIKKADTPYKKFQGKFSSLKSNMTRMEHLIDHLDGNKFGGVFRNVLWNLANTAQIKYEQGITTEYKKINKILKAKLSDVLQDDRDINIRKYFPNVDKQLSTLKRSEVIMALLHSGNTSNKSKLLLGRGWGFKDINGGLNTTAYDAFIADMIAQEVITKENMEGIQEIWDMFEALLPEIQKTHKKVHGYFFETIDATPLQTPWGEFRGGYAPAVTDPLLVDKAAERENQVSTEADENRYAFASTPKGFTKGRVEAYNKALSLDFRIIRSHVEKSVRFTNIEPAVADLNKILGNERFTEAMREVDNTWSNEVFKPWLSRLATQQTERPSDSIIGREMAGWLRFLRRNANQQLMFMNVVNTVENLTDIPALFIHMKARSFNQGLKRYYANPKEATNYIVDNSEFMKLRLEDQIFEINDTYKDMTIRSGTALGKAQKTQDFAAQHTYILQKSLQNAVEVAAWSGAFDERLAAGDSTQQASRYADATIRKVMGSNRAIDMANVEAGHALQKVVLTFYSYFLNKGNLVYHSNKETKAKAYALGIAAPAILSTIFRRAVKGNWDEDGDDEYVDDVFDIFVLSQLRFVAAIFPFGGTASRLVEGQFTDKVYDDRLSISPLLGGLESVKGIKGLLTKDEIRGRDLRDTLSFLGIMSGLPLGPTGKPIGFMIDLEQGKQSADNPLDLTRGIITGRSGKK